MAKRIATSKPRRRHFIKEWRKFRGLTQDQLADRLNTMTGMGTKATVSRVETGDIPYTQDLLEALADALNCAPADLIMRNPSDPEGIWSVWERARQGQRQQIVDVAKVIVGGSTGTDG